MKQDSKAFTSSPCIYPPQLITIRKSTSKILVWLQRQLLLRSWNSTIFFDRARDGILDTSDQFIILLLVANVSTHPWQTVSIFEQNMIVDIKGIDWTCSANTIKTCKLLAWEQPFAVTLDEARSQVLNNQRSYPSPAGSKKSKHMAHPIIKQGGKLTSSSAWFWYRLFRRHILNEIHKCHQQVWWMIYEWNITENWSSLLKGRCLEHFHQLPSGYIDCSLQHVAGCDRLSKFSEIRNWQFRLRLMIKAHMKHSSSTFSEYIRSRLSRSYMGLIYLA